MQYFHFIKAYIRGSHIVRDYIWEAKTRQKVLISHPYNLECIWSKPFIPTNEMKFLFYTCCGCFSIINVPVTKLWRSVRIFKSNNFTSLEGIRSSNCLANCLMLHMISARSSHHFLIIFNLSGSEISSDSLSDSEISNCLWSFFHCISSSLRTFSWTFLYFSQTASNSDINSFLSVSNTSSFCNPNYRKISLSLSRLGIQLQGLPSHVISVWLWNFKDGGS